MDLPKELILVSGSADGCLIVWTYNTLSHQWKLRVQLPAHDGSISCISGLLLSYSQAIISTTSADSSVRIWNLSIPSESEEYDLTLKQVIPVGRIMMEVVSISVLEYDHQTQDPQSIQTNNSVSNLPNGLTLASANEIKSGSALWLNSSSLILAMAGLDNTIHILTTPNSKSDFQRSCTLKGHQDWIRSLDFSSHVVASQGSVKGKSMLFLASSSQDRTVRIWKIFPKEKSSLSINTSLQSMLGEYSQLGLYASRQVFQTAVGGWEVSLETLLTGHEDWVHSVQWQPPVRIKGYEASWDADVIQLYQPMSLLSASMDRTMLVWRLDKRSGTWNSDVAVGQMSHSSLGFYGGVWSADGNAVLAHGHGGALHMWQKVESDVKTSRSFSNGDTKGSNEDGGAIEMDEKWQPVVMPSGHFGSVQDVCWDKTFHFLLTASHDQTTRIFARWSKDNLHPSLMGWHEIARPQIHGHDFNCAVFVRGKGRHAYASGAEEKVIRVFDSPDTFLDSLVHTWGGSLNVEENEKNISDNGGRDRREGRVLGANMSALGLSQKPIYENRVSDHDTSRLSEPNESGGSMPIDEEVEDMDATGNGNTYDDLAVASPCTLLDPPLEEHLLQNTLWPEIHKLYGHGNEIFSMASDHSGRFIASACKAQSASVASIWIWDSLAWQSVAQLESHNLTVTQIEFSPCDRFLVSVSRDRHVSVFQAVPDWTAENGSPFKLLARIEGHKRIIWSISFCSFENIFATASRDKTVKIWKIFSEDDKINVRQLKTLPVFKNGVTAVSFSPSISSNVCLLAVGLEDGKLELWKLSFESTLPEPLIVSRILALDPFLCHVASVKRLAWKMDAVDSDKDHNTGIHHTSIPPLVNRNEKNLLLASCSEDHSVRLFDVLL